MITIHCSLEHSDFLNSCIYIYIYIYIYICIYYTLLDVLIPAKHAANLMFRFLVAVSISFSVMGKMIMVSLQLFFFAVKFFEFLFYFFFRYVSAFP